jgi:hypothetical protein
VQVFEARDLRHVGGWEGQVPYVKMYVFSLVSSSFSLCFVLSTLISAILPGGACVLIVRMEWSAIY